MFQCSTPTSPSPPKEITTNPGSSRRLPKTIHLLNTEHRPLYRPRTNYPPRPASHIGLHRPVPVPIDPLGAHHPNTLPPSFDHYEVLCSHRSHSNQSPTNPSGAGSLVDPAMAFTHLIPSRLRYMTSVAVGNTAVYPVVYTVNPPPQIHDVATTGTP